MGNSVKLRNAIYNNDLESVKRILANVENYCQKEDFLSYAIKNRYNTVVKTVLNFSHVNHKSNRYLANDIAKAVKNDEVIKELERIDNAPLFTLKIISPLTDTMRELFVHKDTKVRELMNGFFFFHGDRQLDTQNPDLPIVDLFVPTMMKCPGIPKWEDTIYISGKLKTSGGFFPRESKTKFVELHESDCAFKTDEYQYLLNSQHTISDNWKPDIILSSKPVPLTLIPLFVVSKDIIIDSFSRVIESENSANFPNLFYLIGNSSKGVKIVCAEMAVHNDNVDFLKSTGVNGKIQKSLLKVAVESKSQKCVEHILSNVFGANSEDAVYDETILRDALIIAKFQKSEHFVNTLQEKLNEMNLLTQSTVPKLETGEGEEGTREESGEPPESPDEKDMLNSKDRIARAEEGAGGMLCMSDDNLDGDF